jgi:cyclic pyranopterin phosphate synthase
VRDALDVLVQAGIEPVVKWFPRCLLGQHGHLLDNRQPQMLIRDSFQDRLSHNFGFNCIHAEDCDWFGRGCDGLHERHVAVFGDSADLLRPERRT